MTKVHARHIRVSSKKKCLEIKKKIEDGGDFITIAMRDSECPSAKNGGDLGEVERGVMGGELDKVLFDDDHVDVVQGPIKTSFGYHLLKVISRKE